MPAKHKLSKIRFVFGAVLFLITNFAYATDPPETTRISDYISKVFAQQRVHQQTTLQDNDTICNASFDQQGFLLEEDSFRFDTKTDKRIHFFHKTWTWSPDRMSLVEREYNFLSYDTIITTKLFTFHSDSLLYEYKELVGRDSTENWRYQYDAKQRVTVLSYKDGLDYMNLHFSYKEKKGSTYINCKDCKSKLEWIVKYDWSGKLIYQSGSEGDTYFYEYDILGRLKTFKHVYHQNGADDQTWTWNYIYDLDGDVFYSRRQHRYVNRRSTAGVLLSSEKQVMNELGLPESWESDGVKQQIRYVYY